MHVEGLFYNILDRLKYIIVKFDFYILTKSDSNICCEIEEDTKVIWIGVIEINI